MSYSITRPLQLRVVAAPLLIVVALQASGCTQRPTPPPPPGGTYLSKSAGAHFDQAVQLANTEDNIAEFNFLRAHRAPHSPQQIYIGAGERGFVKSDNGGETWTQVATPLPAVSDVLLLENGVLVAAGINEKKQGVIIRSSDGGRSWETTLTIPIAVDTGGFRIIGPPDAPASIVMTIELDPFDQNRVYAGSNLGSIFVGEQSAKTWRNLHTLTTRFVDSNDRRRLGVQEIIPSPHQAGTLLIVTSGRRLYRLVGTTQEEIIVPENPEVATPYSSIGAKQVYGATYIKDFPDALFAGVEDGAAISKDNGTSWTSLKLPLDQVETFNTATVAASPTNSARLFVGINSVVYRSEDGGQTWNTFSLGLLTHGITALLIDPTNAAHVLAVTSPIQS